MRGVSTRLLLAGVPLLALGYAVQATRQVTLAITVVDASTRQRTPVRVHLQDASGSTPRVSGALAVSESAIPIPRQAMPSCGAADRAGYRCSPTARSRRRRFDAPVRRSLP
jgi:hypothetical protein